MKNPNGPYPGRQIFIGRTAKGNPAFGYIVTGRSPASRDRRATPMDNSLIMGPTGSDAYDWLRHYTAIKYDNSIGLIAVTNGIQTEAIYETYRLLYHCGTRPVKGYLKKVMDGANYEPDSLQTPRISGLIMNPSGKKDPVYLLSIKTAGVPAYTWDLTFEPGTMAGVSTYTGDMEQPKAFNADKGPSPLACDADAPEAIADYLYAMTAADYKGDDIRVCAVAGVRSDDGSTWNISYINRHKG